jgi:pimeloyl-ACP methyl ester carboxylesterase
MFCTTNDEKKLYYEVKGNYNAKETLVFLNGLSQSTIAWSFITPYFEKDYKIVLLDFIFQGQSDKTGEVRDFDQHASDLLNLMDLLGLNKPILVGLSYGSLVAQHYAVNFPERLNKLILISSFANKTPFYKAIELSWENALKIGGYKHLLDVMLPYVLSDQYFENPLIPIEILKNAKTELIDPIALSKLMAATAQRNDYRQELQRINTSTLVIHGELDLLFPIYMGKEIANNVKNAKFVVIHDAGHTLNLEATETVSKHILQFIV